MAQKRASKLFFEIARAPLALKFSIITLLFSGTLVRAQPEKASQSDRKIKVVYCTRDVQAGSVIGLNSVTFRIIAEHARPPGAVYDIFIAVGRRATKPLSKGKPVLFEQCFSKFELRSAPLIRQLQHRLFLYAEEIDRDLHRKVPILQAVKDLKAGANIDLSDFKALEIEELKLPGQAVGDIWIVLGRKAVIPIRARDYIFYHEVIPFASGAARAWETNIGTSD